MGSPADDRRAQVPDGHSTKSIGRMLGISRRPVEIHRTRAMDKVGARSTTELIRWAPMESHS
jgi:DNA-binding CsgD family transcriptional regulator